MSFKSSLYVLSNIPLSDMSSVNIFSQSMICLFILLVMPFTEQKSFNFNEAELINSSFYELCLWCCIWKVITVPKSTRFTLTLSSRSFVVLCFAVLSLIHFELIFVMAVCQDSFFLFLPVSIQLFWHHLLHRFFFSSFYCLCFFVKDQLSIFVWVYFWVIPFYWSIYLPFCQFQLIAVTSY